MEKRIKTLYIVTIIAILTFLGMQVYWLYGRYEYSLREYEHHAETVIADVLVEYNKERDKKRVGKKNPFFPLPEGGAPFVMCLGKERVWFPVFNGRKLLDI